MSEPTQAVFLRGVNVGGVTVKSAPLCACVESVPGVEKAKTVLASGNVVVRSTLDNDTLKVAVESALRDEFGYEAWVVVLSVANVADLAERCPYAFDDSSTHAYISLASDSIALDAWEAAATDLGQEHLRLSQHALAWTSPAGSSLSTPFAAAQSKKPLSAHATSITTRNGRTLLRVLETADRL